LIGLDFQTVYSIGNMRLTSPVFIHYKEGFYVNLWTTRTHNCRDTLLEYNNLTQNLSNMKLLLIFKCNQQ
jgi:hypothetical protein